MAADDNVLLRFLDAEDFFEDLALMPDSQQVLERTLVPLRSLHRQPGHGRPQLPRTQVSLAAAPLPPSSRPLTTSFAATSPSFEPTFLIDDQPRNLQHFEGKGLLYTAPHNLTVTGYTRVDNWQQVAEFFASIQN